MAVTIRQIAEAAGVSRGTVDRVLHGRSGVRPEVEAHVRKIADELGFLPNRAGRMLAGRKQPLTVGCLLPAVGNPFFDEVKAGIGRAEAELADFGVSVVLREVRGFDPAAHLEAIHALAEGGCQALCLSTVDTPEICACVDGLAASGIPTLALNTDIGAARRLCYVGSDYERGGGTAAGLLDLIHPGRYSLLIVTGSLRVKGHNDRIRGFCRTLREKRRDYTVVDIVECQDSDEHAYHTALEVLGRRPETDCIYIAAAGAPGVCRAVAELGRKGEVCIVCHDSPSAIVDLIRQGMISCTVCQEPELQGYKAVHLLFDYFLDNRRIPPTDFMTSPVIKIAENL